MDPYGTIEPYKVGDNPVGERLNRRKGKPGGGFFANLIGAVSGKRQLDVVQAMQMRGMQHDADMHRAQLEHEAREAQLAHERNINLINKVHHASMTLDQFKSQLQTESAANSAEIASKFIAKKGNRVGAGKFSMEHGPEGVAKVSFEVEPRPEPKPRNAAPKPTTKAFLGMPPVIRQPSSYVNTAIPSKPEKPAKPAKPRAAKPAAAPKPPKGKK